MNTASLRLGNWYYYLMQDHLDKRKVWLKPSQIDLDDLMILTKDPDDELFFEIPITKKILQNAGFQWSEFYSGMVYGPWLIRRRKKIWKIYFHFNFMTHIV